jgi:hypothetical protein
MMSAIRLSILAIHQSFIYLFEKRFHPHQALAYFAGSLVVQIKLRPNLRNLITLLSDARCCCAPCPSSATDCTHNPDTSDKYLDVFKHSRTAPFT